MHTIEKCDVYGGLAFFQKCIFSKFMRVSFRRESFDCYYVKNLFRVTYHLKKWQRQNAGEKGKGKKQREKNWRGVWLSKDGEKKWSCERNKNRPLQVLFDGSVFSLFSVPLLTSLHLHLDSKCLSLADKHRFYLD